MDEGVDAEPGTYILYFKILERKCYLVGKITLKFFFHENTIFYFFKPNSKQTFWDMNISLEKIKE